ncbi:Cyclophilin-like domain superfamily [Arabidopsis suecica]|uniref:peptidylprolyl isomerase n=1 Tax=Arabidopsis suecica TaxID=45249 RepID=A0A8T2BA49_ARASU|nr:Cyclophilin-like domain superfamily [Arabidopsis suecica]
MAKANPKVFFDLTVGGEPAGRIVMELYADKTPKTAENFRALCTGEKGMGKCGKPLHYKGSIIDDIVVGSMWGGGDFIYGNADGSESIYGGLFEDENFYLKHDRPGVLSMANRGPHTNGSQFQIVLKKFPFIDGLHVVFGQVVEGLDVINSIGPKVKTQSGKPSQPVVIADCGQL